MHLFWRRLPYQHRYIDPGLVADVHVTDQEHEESEIILNATTVLL